MTSIFRRLLNGESDVSEREKFYIQAHYYADVTKEIDKAIETYKLWSGSVPARLDSL